MLCQRWMVVGEEFAGCMIENVGGKYILPPMTLNVQQSISVYEPDYESEMKPVYLVIPMTAKLKAYAIRIGHIARSEWASCRASGCPRCGTTNPNTNSVIAKAKTPSENASKRALFTLRHTAATQRSPSGHRTRVRCGHV